MISPNANKILHKFCGLPEYQETLQLIQQLQRASHLHALNEDGQCDIVQFFGEGLTANHEPFYFYLCLDKNDVQDPQIKPNIFPEQTAKAITDGPFVLTVPFNLRFSWDYGTIKTQYDLCSRPLVYINHFNISRVFIGSKIDRELLLNYPREFCPVHIFTEQKNEKDILKNYIRIFKQILLVPVVSYNSYMSILDARRKLSFDKNMSDLIAFQNCPKRKADAEAQYELLTELIDCKSRVNRSKIS